MAIRNLIPHFIAQKSETGERQGSIESMVMLVDLSGFTPLTESLLKKGSRGADELSQILNEIFAPMVGLVYRYGGHIPCFAGDAFAAVFSKKKIEPATLVQLALQTRKLFEDRDYRFGEFTIGIRIGISAGTTEWGLVGSAEAQSFYFRGRPIDQAAMCQQEAEDRTIVIDDAFRELLPASDFQPKELKEGLYLLDGQADEAWEAPTVAPPPLIDDEALLRFFPRELLGDNSAGEFRTVATIFFSFQGASDHDQLNSLATCLLEEVKRYSGYFKEIEFGDKGGVMVIFFGAPVSFENLTERALEFVESVREDLLTDFLNVGLEYRIGMTIGTAFTGIVGGKERSQYAAVGNRVNLAARLMTKAGWGEVLVDEEISKNAHYRFEPKGDVRYKGIQATVPTYKFLGKDHDFQQAFTDKMIGRDKEIKALLDALQPLRNGQCAGLATIFGEAGMGKSRLTYELRQSLPKDTANWYFCPADQILRKPLNPFLYFLREYFQQSPEESPETNRRWFESRINTLLEALEGNAHPRAAVLAAEIRRLQSVLAAQLGIHYPDSLWELLDARGRYQNTLDAVAQLFLAEACLRPTVIQVEDGHWLDENSRDLLEELIRNLPDYPILILITSRYHSDGSKPRIFTIQDPVLAENMPQLEIELTNLSKEAVRDLAEDELEGKIDETFLDMLIRSTNANPFYLKQLLDYFSGQNMFKLKDGLWTVENPHIILSDSVHAILTARIDRLPVSAKETVKAAAVIGPEFDLPILNEVMKMHETFKGVDSPAQHLREQVKKAEQEQIWRTNRELHYAFKHSLLREAAYGMQLQSHLRELHHAIARAIEKLYADKEERYVDLAFHYEQAGVHDKTCKYLRKAANYAKRNYQNQKALEFYEKLLDKMQEKKEETRLRIETYLEKGRILEVVGDWEQGEKTYQHALRLAKKTRDITLLGEANNQLGRLLLLKGQYRDAMEKLQTAARLFESIDDQAGISRVSGNLGNLHFRQGKYEEAKSYFSDSLRINQDLPGSTVDPQIVSNLALTHMNQGNYEEAVKLQQQQLGLCIADNDKQGMASIYTYMGIVYLEKGDLDAAHDSFQKGLVLSIELGNKMLRSVAIGNIGIVNQRRGEFAEAMKNFEEDLRLVEELGDKQGTAIALGLIGELYSVQGEFFKAIEYLQKNLMLCEELNYQKGIAKAVNTLGDVFYYMEQYDRSIHYYDRAIEVTRQIGNKLVLGFSLVEKCGVLIAMEDYESLYEAFQEALQLARKLGNPDLIFQARLVEAQVKVLQQKTEEAILLLKELLQGNLSKGQEAAAWFELHKADPSEMTYRERALELYEALYRTTSRYTYRLRITQLKGDTPQAGTAPAS